MRLEDDRYCFVCGELNASGLGLHFHLDKKEKTLKTEFVPQKIHQGFKGIVHGGIIGLILDETMVNLAWKLEIPCVTAEYSVRFFNPAAVGKILFFSAKIVSEKSRLVSMEGRCEDEVNKIIASSFAKCMKVRN